ncbi:MAG: N-acetylglucosamine kinase [Bacteroidota bacterium]
MNETSFIIGDAGGTSTSWRVVDGEEIKQFKTIGYNAYTHDLADLKENIVQCFGIELQTERPVYLYAAGVSTIEQKREVVLELKEVLGSNLQVENDLVGTARSLCGKDTGNVCILGTGSNACYYDGREVSTVSASLGYVLGDEGSGAYLGKKLLLGIFRDQLDGDIVEAFHAKYELTAHKVIQQIYYQPRPNHFLASFSHFIAAHKHHPEIYRLVYAAFEDFYDAFFFRSEHVDEVYHFSGSIAFHFSDILRQVGLDKGIQIQNIVQSPIAGLVLYHQAYG